MKTYVHLWQYLARFFLEWEVFREKIVQRKLKKNTFCVQWNFLKSFLVWDVKKKYRTARQATDNTAHACCIMDI